MTLLERGIWHVSLTRGLQAVIDDEDRPIVEGYPWYAQSTGGGFYAARRVWKDGTSRIVLMHRLLLSAPDDREVDHIDRDTLNNRRSNLRLATHGQNQANHPLRPTNTSGFRGVSRVAGRKVWRAALSADHGRQQHLGYFATATEAARAYDAAAVERFGAFAQLNFR